MQLRQLGLVLLGTAIGLLVASILHHNAKPDLTATALHTKTLNAKGPNDDVAAIRADYELQIADLKIQNEGLRLQAAKVAGINPPEVKTTEEMTKIYAELRQVSFDSAQRRETEKLIAAGFSPDRIAWIRKRAAERAAEYRQKEDQLRQQGKFDVDAFNAHFHDTDIDLRKELGDDEYANYRRALGRPVGLKIDQVTAGGIGEVAGLRPGDEIIAYNGVRIFNVGELNPLIRQYATSGTSIAVDVLRNGEKIRLSAASGDLRVRSAIGAIPVEEAERLRSGASAVELANEMRARSRSKTPN